MLISDVTTTFNFNYKEKHLVVLASCKYIDNQYQVHGLTVAFFHYNQVDHVDVPYDRDWFKSLEMKAEEELLYEGLGEDFEDKDLLKH